MKPDALKHRELDDEVYEVINCKGEVVCTGNDMAIVDYPEDLTMNRDIGSLIQRVYSKGIMDGILLAEKKYKKGSK